MPAEPADPTAAIRAMAAEFPAVVKGTSCTQNSFATRAGAFLFVGPGRKGQGFKAMSQLDASRAQAAVLAAERPDRFEVGTGAWVTARFTAEEPLPKSIWKKGLAESYGLVAGGAKPKKRTPPRGR